MTEPLQELRTRITAVEQLASTTYGVNEIEHLLEELLAFIVAHPSDHDRFKPLFVSLVDRAADGDEEILVFCMHTLRWAKVREVAESRRDAIPSDEMGRRWYVRRYYERIVDSYEGDWENALLYRYYRRNS